MQSVNSNGHLFFFQTEKMNLGNDVISWLDFDFKKNPKLNFYSNESLLKRL